MEVPLVQWLTKGLLILLYHVWGSIPRKRKFLQINGAKLIGSTEYHMYSCSSWSRVLWGESVHYGNVIHAEPSIVDSNVGESYAVESLFVGTVHHNRICCR